MVRERVGEVAEEKRKKKRSAIFIWLAAFLFSFGIPSLNLILSTSLFTVAFSTRLN